MSFKNPVQSLRDIVDAITSIEEFTSAMDFAAFRSHQGPALCPDQPGPKIRGTANWIRHQYERINLDDIWLEDIWRTVTDDLPSLKASADRAPASPPAG